MFLPVYDVSMACRSASVGIGQLLVVVPITKVPFNLALGLATIAFSQGDASVVVRRRQLLLDLAARAIKRIANTPSPNAAFAVPYLVKASVIDHAGF